MLIRPPPFISKLMQINWFFVCITQASQQRLHGGSSKKQQQKSPAECSDEYTSSLSPVSTSSTMSSTSTKNAYTFVSIKAKSFTDKQPQLSQQPPHSKSSNKKETTMTTNTNTTSTSMNQRKSGTKAISDVINRLNLSLPNSTEDSAELDEAEHHHSKTKKLCTHSIKEDSDEEAYREEEDEERDDENDVDVNEVNDEKDDEEESDTLTKENPSVYNNDSLSLVTSTSNNINKVHSAASSSSSTSSFLLNDASSSTLVDAKMVDMPASGYKCTHCNIIFNEYSLYSIHAGMHSNKNPWQCSVCGHGCANKVDFNVHILHLSKIWELVSFISCYC